MIKKQFLCTILCFSALVLTACGTTDITKASLTADSPKAGILLKISAPSSPKSQLNLNQASKTSDDGSYELSGGLRIANFGGFKLNEPRSGYVFTLIEPGTYVVKSFSQQGYWGLCFKEDTYVFDVKPGHITLIGEYNPRQDVRALSQRVASSGNLSTGGEVYHYFDNIQAPEIASATTEDLTAAKAYVEKFAPEMDAPVINADITPAKFLTGRDAFGKPICQPGYYTKE